MLPIAGRKAGTNELKFLWTLMVGRWLFRLKNSNNICFKFFFSKFFFYTGNRRPFSLYILNYFRSSIFQFTMHVVYCTGLPAMDETSETTVQMCSLIFLSLMVPFNFNFPFFPESFVKHIIKILS